MSEIKEKKSQEVHRVLERAHVKSTNTFVSSVFQEGFEKDFDGRKGVTGKRKGIVSGKNNQ
jgi:hypothetical protein